MTILVAFFFCVTFFLGTGQHRGDARWNELKDTSEVVSTTDKYIRDFDATRRYAANADDLIGVMKRKYPELDLDFFLTTAAKKAFAN